MNEDKGKEILNNQTPNKEQVKPAQVKHVLNNKGMEVGLRLKQEGIPEEDEDE